MSGLIDKLYELLQPNRAELIDFEDLLPRYNRKAVDRLSEDLQALQEQGLLLFERQEYGFLIELLNKE